MGIGVNSATASVVASGVAPPPPAAGVASGAGVASVETVLVARASLVDEGAGRNARYKPAATKDTTKAPITIGTTFDFCPSRRAIMEEGKAKRTGGFA